MCWLQLARSAVSVHLRTSSSPNFLLRLFCDADYFHLLASLYRSPKTRSAWFILRNLRSPPPKLWNARKALKCSSPHSPNLEMERIEIWGAKKNKTRNDFGSFTHWPTVTVELKWRNQNITAKRIDKQFLTQYRNESKWFSLWVRTTAIASRSRSLRAEHVSLCLVCLMYDEIWMKRTGLWLGRGVRFQSEYVWIECGMKTLPPWISFNCVKIKNSYKPFAGTSRNFTSYFHEKKSHKRQVKKLLSGFHFSKKHQSKKERKLSASPAMVALDAADRQLNE